MRVFEEAARTDDELMAEYLGGILASAHAPGSRDDRGAILASLVGRLSSYQVRAHYLIYRALHRLLSTSDSEELAQARSKGLGIEMPVSGFLQALEFAGNEDVRELRQHVFRGLEREALVNWPIGGGPASISAFAEVPEGGLSQFVAYPTSDGLELYLFALSAQQGVEDFLTKPDVEQPDIAVPAIDGCRLRTG